MGEKSINIEFNLDYLNILKEDDDCMLVQLDLLHLGINRNRCDISKECVDKSLPTIFNKPIIYRLNNKFSPENSTDVVEHARNDYEDKTVYIAGTIPESSPVEYVDRDDKTYLRMMGIIHKIYQPVLVNILKKRNGNVKVSIEIKAKGIVNSEKIFVIEEFIFESVCLLGEGIKEGIEGSQLVVTKFSLEEYNQHYLSFAHENNTNDTETFTKKSSYNIPKKVKENAQRGLDLRKEYGRGGTNVGIKMAKYIVSNESATYEKVKKISEYFPRHMKDNLNEINPPSNGYIAWNLWGGDEGMSWSKNIVDKVKEQEDKQSKNTLEFIAKDVVGTKSAIEIDKSKDSLSEDEWGEVDKSALKKECLEASNYKTLCKDVFLVLQDGWEEGKEGSLGYPVMQKKGDKVVYNRSALGSAKAYASKNNETEVLSKLKSIYEHLDLPWEEEIKNNEKEDDSMADKIEFSLNSNQIYDIFSNAISEIRYMEGNYESRKFYVRDYNETFVFLINYEDGKLYKMSYVLNEDNTVTIDFDSAVVVIQGDYVEVGSGNPKVVTNTDDNTGTDEPEMGMDDNNTEEMEEMMEWKNKYAELESKYTELENSYNELKNSNEELTMKHTEMETKYNSMTEEMNTYKESLAKYARQEEEMKMNSLLQEFAHCFSEDEMKDMPEKIKNSKFADFESLVNAKIKDFALKVKESKKEDQKVNNSYGVSFSVFGQDEHFDYSKTNNADVSLEEKYGVKIK